MNNTFRTQCTSTRIDRQPNMSAGRPSFKKVLFFIFLSFIGIVLVWLAFIRHVNNNPPPLDPFILKINDAQLSDKWNHDADLQIEDEGKFHMVTNIVLFTHKAYNVNLLYDNRRPPTEVELEKRQREVEVALQENLNNKNIAAVHVLYFHPAVSMYLLKLSLKNSKKLVLHLTRRDPSVGVNLDYIQKYLRNKYVILAHMDNFIGEGWDDIDLTRFRTQHMMYALTRHSVTEEYPCNAALGASCNPGSMYLGSHDMFIWFSDRSFSRKLLKDLDIVPSSSGMENVLIWYFRKELGFKVLNPCQRIKIYHNHCIPIREKGRKRYNMKGKNGLAPFTNRLF